MLCAFLKSANVHAYILFALLLAAPAMPVSETCTVRPATVGRIPEFLGPGPAATASAVFEADRQ